MATKIITTHTLPPPTERITPAVARQWLHRSYPALSDLAGHGYYPHMFGYRGSGLRRSEREPAAQAARSLGLDLRQIVSACGRALATGRPVRMRFDPEANLVRARNLRALARYQSGERSAARALPTLRRAIAAHERAERAATGDTLDYYREQRAIERRWRKARPEASA